VGERRGDVHLEYREGDGRITLRWILRGIGSEYGRWVDVPQDCVQWRSLALEVLILRQCKLSTLFGCVT